ncbi:MAG: MFS transporter, partial [Thaumarchaeota archaeon]|nr:MFS transporter [Nitrososphaerota archaeon]
NAIGTVLAVTAIKRHNVSSILGFSFLFFALLEFAFLASATPEFVGILVTIAGIGMGLPQPFLAPLMHLSSREERPFAGIGLYSVALSIGLIAGPLAGSVFLTLGGFPVVFLALSGVALIGIVIASVLAIFETQHNMESIASQLSLSKWIAALRKRKFANALVLNFLYSMLLPVVTSYAGLLGEDRFGISASSILLAFTGSFVISALIRIYLTKRSSARLELLIIPSVGFLIVSIM